MMIVNLQKNMNRLPKIQFAFQFCREMRLPAEVEPDKTAAVLKDGVLKLVFTKAAESEPIAVEVKPE